MQKKSFGGRLTQELHHGGGFGDNTRTHNYGHDKAPSVLRAAIDKFTIQVGAELQAQQISGQTCGETGDGHFLKMLGAMCKSALIVDKYDKRADVPMDLNLAPESAPEAVKKAQGSLDIVVSHQVFEHLIHPTIGIANLNALLRVQGRLIFSTPFVVPDHQCPKDYFRYTVRSIHQLLQCAGFEVHTLNGFGSRLSDIAFIAGIAADSLEQSDQLEVCDGLATDDCSNKYYTSVAAVGIKTKDVNVDEIRTCFG